MTEPARSDPDLLNSATGAGLIYFCEIMIKRNEMTKATGSALRTGCKKVLDTEEDPDAVDLRSLDMEALFRRFVNKNRVELNDNSLRTYKQRFKQTVEMYLKFIDGEPDWNTVKGRTGTSSTKTPRAAKPSKSDNVVEIKPGSAPSAPPSDSDAVSYGTIEWAIPVRPGITGKLVLPDRMSQHEVAKVVKMMTALAQAVEEQLALPPGSSDF